MLKAYTTHLRTYQQKSARCLQLRTCILTTGQAVVVTLQGLGCCGAFQVKVIICRARALHRYRTARNTVTNALARICRVGCRRLHCLAHLHVPVPAGKSALRVPLLLMQAAQFKLPGLQYENDYRDRRATGAIFIIFGRCSARLAREFQSRWAV